MRRLVSVAAVLALLAAAGCGDDEEPTTAGATGSTGAQDVSGSDTDLTASGFIGAPIPDQVEAVQDLVAENPDCEDVDAKPGSEFQVGVAISAAQADPDTPLSEIIAERC